MKVVLAIRYPSVWRIWWLCTMKSLTNQYLCRAYQNYANFSHPVYIHSAKVFSITFWGFQGIFTWYTIIQTILSVSMISCMHSYVTVKTEMLLWPKVCCFSSVLDTNCYCELVIQMLFMITSCSLCSTLGNTRNSLRASPYISTVHSCNYKTTNLWSQQLECTVKALRLRGHQRRLHGCGQTFATN